jgi:glycosyltransferase involved in cell wall biosynthesis
MNSIKTPNILFVAHHPISGQWVGGIEVYLANIAKVLSQKYGVLIYTPKMDSHGLVNQIVDSHGNLLREISYLTPYSNWQLTSPEREQAFATILDELDIDLVHFHHLAGHPPSLIAVANQKGVPTVFSAHDFFSICHVSNLINDAGRYCNPATLTMQQCDNCLSNAYGVLPGSQLKRRNAWKDLLASCNALIFNTQSSVDLITSIYPEISKHPKQYLAPVPIPPITRIEKQPAQPSPLKVAVMGNFLHHKGADTILSTMKALKDESIEFHVFGNVDTPYLERMGPLLDKSVCLHGPYSTEKMPAALWDCQVSLHVSIWPETYCLTLSEASTIGLVPVVTDIGALGERVTQDVNGLKIEVDSVEQLCTSLRGLSTSPKMLSKLQNPTLPVPCAQMIDHLNILHGIYDPLIKSNEKKSLDDLSTEQLTTNTSSTSIDWASFTGQKPLSTSQPNHSAFSSIKAVLRRVLR